MRKITKKKNNKKKELLSWMSKKLEVKETIGYGKGVFAKEEIGKDEMLAVFGGYVLDVSVEEKLPGNLSDYSLQISENLVIGPAYKNEISDSEAFNHSCSPNAGFKGQIFLVAIRNIKRGEQIAFDYAMVLSKAKNAKFYKMKCLCGSKNCRGHITDNDWKNPELQKKYNGYFQWYLQEKINKSKKK